MTAAFEELRQQLIEKVTEALILHQVPDYSVRCKCGKPLHSGEPGSMTLSRHRAERIVDDILCPAACTISAMVSDNGVPSGP